LNRLVESRPDREAGPERPRRTERLPHVAERERSLAPPYGGVFLPRAKVMSSDDLRRAITRIAHEIVERNHGLHNVVLVGLQTGGVPLARRLAEALAQIEPDMPVPVGSLDVAFY